MLSRMEWTDYASLINREYFLLSRNLLDMETNLGRELPDSLHWSRRFEYPWVYLSLQPFEEKDIVLDAGAGYSVFHLFVSEMVKEVHSVDTDAKSVDWLNKLVKRFPNVFCQLGDLTQMAYPSGYFDKTVCISTLEHLAKNKVIGGIEELIRVTKPGGKIAITMDIVLEGTDKQIDLTDFRNIADKYSIVIPQHPKHMMVFRVPPYNFPFTIACILMGAR